MKCFNKNPLGNQYGVSLVEGMVAAAIVVTASAATMGLSTYIHKQSRRAQLYNRAISVQSQLVSALLNKDQYSTSGPQAAFVAQMAASNNPVGMKIYSDPVHQKGVLATVGSGNTVGYSIDGVDSSSASQCPASGCPIQVDVDFNCQNLASQGCAVAYRVTLIPDGNDVRPAPLGALPGVFQPSDYTLQLSYDFFSQLQSSDCSSNPDNILITGMNRTIGNVTCAAKTSTSCPAGQVAYGVTLDPATKRLNLMCHPLGEVKCPTDYVLQKFNFSQLDLGPTTPQAPLPNLAGTCVYRWKNNIPWQGPAFQTAPTTGTASYSAAVCNPDVYTASPNGSCAIVWDSNPPVNCPNTCPTYDSSGNQTGFADCSYQVAATATVSSSMTGIRGSCTVNVTQGACSGGVTHATAHGVWSGTCKVRVTDLTLPPVGGHF